MIESGLRPAADAGGRESRNHGTALLPAACYDVCLPSDRVPWHWHEELELLVVNGGSACVRVDHEELKLEEGQGLFINSGVMHTVWSRSWCRIRSAVFHPRLVGGSSESVLWSRYLDPLTSDHDLPYVLLDGGSEWHREVLNGLNEAWEACLKEEPGFEFVLRDGLSRSVRSICIHHAAPAAALAPKVLRNWERMKLMLRCVGEHLGENLTVEQIAAAAAVSRSECLRCFRETIGESPMQYVLQLRVQRAAARLEDTEAPVGEIARACGFQDMSYFARAFRSRQGCTPQEYRTRAREKASNNG